MNRRLPLYLGILVLIAAAGCGGEKVPPRECSADSDCIGSTDVCTVGVCSPESKTCEYALKPCLDDDPCTIDACVPGTGGCTHTQKTCDDGDPCTTETCDPADGVCKARPRDCDDGDPCTTDSCVVGTGECAHTRTTCDDGNACTTDECDPETGECIHRAVTCDDGNACTVDTCSPTTGTCEHADAQNGTPCDDGNPATVNDACKDGACKGGTATDPTPCRIEKITFLQPEVTFPIGGTPEVVNDVLGAALTAEALKFRAGGFVALFDPLDLAASTASLTFGEGACALDGGSATACNLLPGGRTAEFPAITYSAVDGCSTDPLVESPCFLAPEKAFDLSAIAPEWFPSGSGSVTGRALGAFVMTGATLDRIGSGYVEGFVPEAVGRAAVAGRSIDIGGGPVLLDDVLDTIATTTEGGVTGWRLRLGFEATCVALLEDLGCLADPAGCDDGNPCTADSCDAGTRQCLHVAKVCDDGDECNGVETCSGTTGACVPGQAMVCDDGNPCNGVYACMTGHGCVMTEPVPVCDDGDPCNGVETCEPQGGCTAGTPPTCEDGNVCNGVSTCATGVGCQLTTPPPTCSDENPCNGVETCDPVEGCLPGEAADCDDRDGCTTDSCEPANGCVHVLHYASPDCEPVVDIVFPPRGATLDPAGGTVTIRGTARNYDGKPLSSFTLIHDGVESTVATDPSGAFEKTVTPAQGLNTIVATKTDAFGNGAHHVRGYYASDRWYLPDPADPTASFVPAAAVAWVAKEAWDDNAPDYDDVASMLQAVAENANLSSYFASVNASGVSVAGCTWDVSVSDIVVHDVTVDLDPQSRQRVNSLEYDHALMVKIQAGTLQATVNLVPSTPQAAPCDAPQSTTMSVSMNVLGWVGLAVSGTTWTVTTDWPFGSKFNPPWAAASNLLLSPCALGGLDLCDASAQSALKSALEGAVKDAVRLQVPALLQGYLNRDRWESFDIQKATMQLPSWIVTAWGRPTSATIEEAGVTMAFDLAAVTDRAPGVVPTDTTEAPFRGSIGRGHACPATLPTWPVNADPLSAALHDDALNQAVYALWEAGGLTQAFDTARLVGLGGTDPATWGFTDLVLDTAPLLPPIANECTADGRLALQAADTRVHATGLYLGRPFEATLYFTGDLHASIGIVEGGATGRMVTIATDLVPTFADFELTAVTGDVGKDALRAGLDNVVRELPAVMGVSRAYPVPVANVTAVAKKYLGVDLPGPLGTEIVLDVTPSALVRSAGYTVFTVMGK